MAILSKEGHLEFRVSKCGNASIVRPVDEFLTRPFIDFSFEIRQQVVPVQVNLVLAIDGLVPPGLEFFFDVFPDLRFGPALRGDRFLDKRNREFSRFIYLLIKLSNFGILFC